MSKAEDAADAPAATEEQVAGLGQELSGDEAFLAARLQSQQISPEPEEVSEELTEAERPSESEDAPEGSGTEQEDVYADLDLTEEEREHLEENPQSRLAKRINGLVRERKEAEEKLQQALAAQQQSEPDPLERKDEGPNPFDNIDSIEGAAEKAKELDDFIEWAETTLEDNEDELVDAVIYEEGNQEFTKKDVRKRLRQARKERRTHLPGRVQEIQKTEGRKHEAEHFEKLTKEQLGWMAEEESDTYKAYLQTANDPLLAKIEQAVPEVGPRLKYIIAHAINSLEGGAKAPPAKPQKKPQAIQPKAIPPATPGGNAAAPSKKRQSMADQMKAAEARAIETGSEDAFLQARALAHS